MSRNLARIGAYDYTLLQYDSLTQNTRLHSAIAVAHCIQCSTTFTAISGSGKGADKIIRQKFRNHIKDKVCERKSNDKARQSSTTAGTE